MFTLTNYITVKFINLKDNNIFSFILDKNIFEPIFES